MHSLLALVYSYDIWHYPPWRNLSKYWLGFDELFQKELSQLVESGVAEDVDIEAEDRGE